MVSLPEYTPYILQCNSARVYQRSYGKEVCLYGHHAHFVTLLLCMPFVQDTHRTSVGEGFCSRLCLNLLYHSKTSVTPKVGRLTTAKFKLLIIFSLVTSHATQRERPALWGTLAHRRHHVQKTGTTITQA
jgi:hypothetical protein